MKNFLTKIPIVVVTILVVPQIALAAWWNPFSWKIWDIFRATPAPQEQQIATSTVITPPKEKEEQVTEGSQITPQPSAQPAKPIETPVYTPPPPVTPSFNQEAELQRLRAEQEQREREAAARKQQCLNTYPSKAQIQKATDAAIATLTSSHTSSKASITSSYDAQIAQARAKMERELTSAREAQRGFATNNALLQQIKEQGERAINDLEQRKQELLATADATYAREVSVVQARALDMERTSSEVMCDS